MAFRSHIIIFTLLGFGVGLRVKRDARPEDVRRGAGQAKRGGSRRVSGLCCPAADALRIDADPDLTGPGQPGAGNELYFPPDGWRKFSLCLVPMSSS